MAETPTPTAATPAPTVYERCDQCSAPVDERQRYCVACGSRRRGAEDPVAQYLAVATSRARAARSPRPDGARRRRAPGLGTAAVIAAIPLAVALGVIVGRANSGGDAQLIAALRAQKPPVVRVTGGGAGAASASPAAVTTHAVASTFTLPSGFAVELQTLPAQGTDQASVAQAERAATAKGATALGVIDVTSFSVIPKPAGTRYILYSGQFRTRSQAAAALTKLKRHFPGAVVIAVRSSAPASAGAAQSGPSQINVVASKSKLAQGAAVVKQLSHDTGKAYVQAQNQLPSVISVP